MLLPFPLLSPSLLLEPYLGIDPDMEPDLLLGQLVLQLHGGYYPVDCLIPVSWLNGSVEWQSYISVDPYP